MPQSEPFEPMCPICGKPVVEAVRPFCSRRCANVDLGRWLTGQYRVRHTSNATGDDEATE
jgi:endogenous inhibitor of DNA gyrase (YacG/DUF329 family)